MDEVEERFLAAIAANPGDREARLVYADWLEERGDPRGEYLRIEVQLNELPARLAALNGTIDRAWLDRVARVHDVVLFATGPDKIAVIKAVRELAGLGLKESKDLVESVTPDAPRRIASYVDMIEAQRHLGRFDGTGAKVALVPRGGTVATVVAPRLTVTLEEILGPRDQVLAVLREELALPRVEVERLIERVIAGEPMVIVRELLQQRAEHLVGRLAPVARASVKTTELGYFEQVSS